MIVEVRDGGPKGRYRGRLLQTNLQACVKMAARSYYGAIEAKPCGKNLYITDTGVKMHVVEVKS